MDPASIAIGSTVLGGIVGAVGSYGKGQAEAASLRLQGQAKGEQYDAQAKAYQYKAGIAEMNRRVKLEDADYARWAGEQEAVQSGMKTRFTLGTARAKQSGSGLDVDFGSPSQVRDSILQVGQYDTSMIRSNAAKRAYGFEVEAASQEAEKNLDIMSAESSSRAAMFSRQGANMAADTAETTGMLGAFQSILGASSSVSSKWLQGSQLGIGSGNAYFPSESFMNNSWGY